MIIYLPQTINLQLANASASKRINARHQPPRIQHGYKGVSRMKAALFAVGCMALLGFAWS